MTDVPPEVLALAAQQFGAIARGQARRLGWTERQERRARHRGEWTLETRRVLVRTGSARSFKRDAMVALLDAGDGSALSFPTGAASYRVAGFPRYPIHVSRPRDLRNRKSTIAIVHQPMYLPPHHLLRVDGLPVTSPTRTLFDLANDPGMHPKRVERAIDSAWAARLTSRARLLRMEDEWCERGRRGSAFIHEFLATRGPDYVPPESGLEARFIHLITEAGMPAPRSQVDAGDDESWIGRIDCVDPEFPHLMAEIDSDRFHIAPLDKASDERRDERLTAAGCTVVRFTEFKVWHRGREVVEEWRTARAEARAAVRQRAVGT